MIESITIERFKSIEQTEITLGRVIARIWQGPVEVRETTDGTLGV